MMQVETFARNAAAHLERIAHLERQNADLQAANNRLLERARAIEARFIALVRDLKEAVGRR